MLGVYPHEFFRLDFDQMLQEGHRQEHIHPANAGEELVATRMHGYFRDTVLPLIQENDWVYQAAREFALNYAMDCFYNLRLDGRQVYETQQRLLELNQRTQEFRGVAAQHGAVRHSRLRDVGGMLPKASDFHAYVKMYALPQALRREANQLHEDTVDHEALQVRVVLRSIQSAYEMPLPRVMHVVRRVIKVQKDLAPKASDESLADVSEQITWYEAHVGPDHPLYPVFGELRTFYKPARNTASHPTGLKWEPEANEVVLVEQDARIPVHVHTFLQRYRYLTYLCEIGLRGILAGFCERERGAVSTRLVKEYAKTFPGDFPGGEQGFLIPYPEAEIDSDAAAH